MSEWAGGEPTLAGIEREFPGWHCWRGVSGLVYARRGPGSVLVQGEDARDLRDQVIRAQAQDQDGAG